MSDLPGLPGYRILECLGEGGVGIVYRAFDIELGREVAIKWLKQATPASMERLQREAFLHARVEHPAVLRLYRVGEHEGTPYLVMQLIHGQTLDRLIPDLDLDTKLRLLVTVADGIHAAHGQDLIHRDLKPSNILVEEGTQSPYIVDFGLARDTTCSTLTEAGLLMGSPAYMAPEQTSGSRVDARTDVYGLGATLFELLTGRPPFLGGSTEEICAQIQTREAPRLRTLAPGLARDLETILETCLSKDPDRRYATAAALRDDLLRVLEGAPIQTRRRSLAERGQGWIRRNLLTTLLGVLALISGLLFAMLWARAQQRARIQTNWALRFGQETQRMDEVLRFGRMMPLHDVSGELAKVRQHMDRIRAQMTGEPLSRGPGHVALGEGYLLLQQPQLARPELEAAWQEGYRPLELSLALGRCFSSLYNQAREEHLNIQDAKERSQALESDRRELREPAVLHLRKAKQGMGSLPALVELQLSLVEERWEDVATQARAIHNLEPWRSEPLLQLARANLAQGIQKSAVQDISGCRKDLEAALEVAEQARAVSPSDESLIGILYSIRWTGHTVGLQGLDRRTALMKTTEICEQAAALNIQRLGWLNEEAMVLITMAGDCVDNRTGDPTPWFNRAERILDDAIQQPPEKLPADFRVSTCGLMEYLLSNEATYRLIRNEEVKPLVDKGLRIAEIAQAEGKPNYRFYIALASLCQTWAQQRYERGQDPGEALDLAIRHFRNAARYDPPAYDLMMMGNTLNFRTRLHLEQGKDPTSSIEEMDRILDIARKAAPDLDGVHQNDVDARLLKARWAQQQQQDPLPELLRARNLLELDLAREPKDASSLCAMARCCALLAEVRKNRGEDPTRDARKALECGRKGLKEILNFPIQPTEVKDALRRARKILQDSDRRR